ncbi:MAG: YvcK family protein [Anaerolineales bacterium]
MKRWLILMVLGTALIGLGLAVILLDIYRAQPQSPWLAILSLRSLPRIARAAIFGATGLGILVFAVFRLNRSLLEPFRRAGKPVVEVVAEHRRRERGPKVVSIGGGTGLSTLLRGLKERTSNLTAVVTVADDGGSSGRLRRALGLPPPGDLRSCLAALSNDEDLLSQLFQYRFREGEELDGHSFGNLFIAALAGVTGSFDQGILEAGRVLAIRGRVIPSTLADVFLVAEKTPKEGSPAIRVEGESRIPEAPGSICRVQLEPSEPPAYPGAIQVILNADMVTIGPGSLYTSVLPNLLVPDITEAIRASKAFKLYICNIATQPGETDGYDVGHHLKALENHVGPGLVDMVVANDRMEGKLPKGVDWVALPQDQGMSTPCYYADLADAERPWRHDSFKLTERLIALLEERTGPLELLPVESLEALGSL